MTDSTEGDRQRSSDSDESAERAPVERQPSEIDEQSRETDEQPSETDEQPSIGRDREERLEQIDAWAAYVRSHPDEEWGRQVNALIESQLRRARAEQFDRPDLAHMRDPAAEDNDIRRPPIAREDDRGGEDDSGEDDVGGEDDDSGEDDESGGE